MKILTIHNIVEFLKPIISVNKHIKHFLNNKMINSTTILTYHSISDHRKFKYSRHYTINPQLLNLQMNYLYDNNFKVINLAELYDRIQGRIKVNQKTLVLTFDDGHADSYIYACPILKKYGFCATFFLISSFVGSKNLFPWLHEPIFPQGENLPLSAEQILDMAKEGMDFGSHTLSHQRLSQLSQNQAYKEINESKTYLEELLGREINYFSYPYGSWNDFDHTHQEIVRKAGYKLAVTSIYGSNSINSNLFSLRRIPIYGSDNLNTFRMKINGYYDWIEKVQKLLFVLHNINN